MAKVEGTLVQYRGTGPALIDLMAGTIDAVLDQTVVMLPPHADHRIRNIAVTAAQRLPQMPDAPPSGSRRAAVRPAHLERPVAPKGTPRG